MKRILVLNFFPAFTPPSSGGELRYFNMYSRLSQYFDITLLSPTYSNHKREVVVHSPTFREHRVPKEQIHEHLQEKIAKDCIADEFSALICSLAARYPNAYHEAYLELQANADCIIHEFPYMLEYDMLLGVDQRPRIYNSHNVESDLVAQMWKGPEAEKYISHVSDLENRLIQSSKLCFAVSQTEAARFSEKFGVSPRRFCIAENGINPDEFLPRTTKENQRVSALFFGSFHSPNIEATRFIIDKVAPACPSIDFLIAGKCLAADTPGLPENVKALGLVDNETRLQLFANADIALNPMFSGAGTNLKALEYLAAGLPMISTAIGARGIDLVDYQNVVIADQKSFARLLNNLAQDASLRQRIAAAGRTHVIEQFSWDSIARRTAQKISTHLENWNPPPLRSLLLLNDFSVADPHGGGEVRINRLYRALADHYRITLVCLTYDGICSRAEIKENFVEIRIPKSESHREIEHAQQWPNSPGDIINFLEGPRNPLLKKLVAALHARSDAVILSHPYMAGLIADLEGVPVIFEALNVESILKRQVLEGHPSYGTLIAAAEKCERMAIRLCNELILVSEADKDGMAQLGGKREHMHVILNGVDVPLAPRQKDRLDHVRAEMHGKPMIVFIGSAHAPNVEAANYIIDILAPQFPECQFGIVGSVCIYFKSAPPNVLLFGTLDEGAKDIVIELADIAINPMQSGSGSNLKLAEFFAKSLPTVTTTFGARGYAITDGEHAVICSLEDFPERLRALMHDARKMDQLAKNSFAFAKMHLDWSLQAQRYRNVLERTIFSKGKRKLLVVTYRFTDPPMGGAETYLLELLRQLDRSGEFLIDVATLDIVKIENQFHFACRYERDANFPWPQDIANLKVMRFPAEEVPEIQRLENARALFGNWMEEWCLASDFHLEDLPNTILLGGWYFPEISQKGTGVWSSIRARIRVKGVRTVILRGHTPTRNHLKVFAGDSLLFSKALNGDFDLRVDTGGEEVLELRLESSYLAPGDPRPLGMWISEVLCETENGISSLPLGVNNRDILKQAIPKEFIKSQIEIADRRSPAMEDLFQKTRGPNSAALESWLAEHMRDYDFALGHSVPFKTIVMAANAAKSSGVPLIQLPHVHVDDEFYHWRNYFDALRAAKFSIIHPRAAAPLFFDQIGAKGEYLPFGVDAKKQPTHADEQALQKLLPSTLPYVLVLGRKDRTKNYQHVINAVAELNCDDPLCNVVMIGRDEDGDALDPNQVVYLGSQPEGIVLAALKHALCLISMSDSESFGIVVLESWSQGRPVIVSETCHASVELVTDGENGLLANPQNLSKIILSLLENKSSADRMGRAGRQKLLAEFTWDAVGKQLLKYFS